MESHDEWKLPDVSSIPLEELRQLDNPKLAKAKREVAEAASSDQQVVAGFGSAI